MTASILTMDEPPPVEVRYWPMPPVEVIPSWRPKMDLKAGMCLTPCRCLDEPHRPAARGRLFHMKHTGNVLGTESESCLCGLNVASICRQPDRRLPRPGQDIGRYV